jgi:hypothetical protein
VAVLQDLCPRCGAALPETALACPACAYDQLGRSTPTGADSSHQRRMQPPVRMAIGIAAAGVLIMAFGTGWRLSARAERDPPITHAGPRVPSPPPIGRVLFGERLGPSLELEGHRRAFRSEETIAWRVEFVAPPLTDELTLVIEWQSIRERMELSQTTVPLADPALTVIGREEMPLGDLVPTAGLYSVAYYSGDAKLAEGVFELLPRDR